MEKLLKKAARQGDLARLWEAVFGLCNRLGAYAKEKAAEHRNAQKTLIVAVSSIDDPLNVEPASK